MSILTFKIYHWDQQYHMPVSPQHVHLHSHHIHVLAVLQATRWPVVRILARLPQIEPWHISNPAMHFEHRAGESITLSRCSRQGCKPSDRCAQCSPTHAERWFGTRCSLERNRGFQCLSWLARERYFGWFDRHRQENHIGWPTLPGKAIGCRRIVTPLPLATASPHDRVKD